MNLALVRPGPRSFFPEEILAEDPTLPRVPEEHPSVFHVIEDVRGYMKKTPPVKGLLSQCCTEVQQIVMERLILKNGDPRVIAQDLTRMTGEMVHPDDVRLAAQIATDNLRMAHVCGL